MQKRTLQLFQLLLIIFSFYLPVVKSNDPPLFLSLACLTTAFLVGKLETRVTEATKLKKRQSEQVSKKKKSATTTQALDWVLRSKNVQLLIDAIQTLFQDLGMTVSSSLQNSSIDRQIKIPGMQVTWCLKVLKDVDVLNDRWDQWDDLSAFELGKGGKQRVLIVASNSLETAGDSQKEHTGFSADSHKLLAAKQVVAMTTLTLCKIYLKCKKNKDYTKTVFQPIENHPGGVVRV